MTEDELFPLSDGKSVYVEFNSCPVCGSSERLIEKAYLNEVKQGKAPPSSSVSAQQLTTYLHDPSKAIFSVPIVVSQFDICLGWPDKPCGNYYCVRADKIDAQVTQKIKPKSPGPGPDTDFPFQINKG